MEETKTYFTPKLWVALASMAFLIAAMCSAIFITGQQLHTPPLKRTSKAPSPTLRARQRHERLPGITFKQKEAQFFKRIVPLSAF